MKIEPGKHQRRIAQRGLATIAALALMSILTIMITADFLAARTLNRELKLIEKRQLERINGSHPGHPPAANNNPSHG